MATKYIVNNVTGQTINGESVQRPYKVYSAIITQSGSNNYFSISEQPLVVGVTYQIISNNGTGDFLNVGAPDNEVGTYFVATGTTPTFWGAGELEYSTGTPVVTVLENTIGNIYFAYNSVGSYYCKTEPQSLFTVGKTVGFIGSAGDDGFAPAYGFLRQIGADLFAILTQDFSGSDSNGMLLNTSIEIRVYN